MTSPSFGTRKVQSAITPLIKSVAALTFLKKLLHDFTATYMLAMLEKSP
jgi:hypothetical protein